MSYEELSKDHLVMAVKQLNEENRTLMTKWASALQERDALKEENEKLKKQVEYYKFISKSNFGEFNKKS